MTEYEALAEDLQDREHARVGNNTHAHRVGPDLITITLHGNTILTFSSAGTIGVSDAGWPTLTTTQRLNAFTPARYLFTRKAGTVYVIDRWADEPERTPLDAVEFLDPDAPRGAGVVRKAVRT